MLFLKETAEPYLTVGVWVGKHLEKGWPAFKVKVDCADKRSHRIKGRGSLGRQQAEEHVWDVPRNKDTFDAEIDPIHDQIREVVAPVLLLLVDMGFKQKPITTVAHCEVAFVVFEFNQRNGGRRESWEDDESPLGKGSTGGGGINKTISCKGIGVVVPLLKRTVYDSLLGELLGDVAGKGCP
jgi:hypothetical protein